LLLLAVVMPSCNDDPPTGASPPSANYPLRHSAPACAPSDSIVFQDLGVTCVLPTGEYFVDSSKAGIYVADQGGASRRRLLSTGTNPVWGRTGDEIAFELNGSIVATPTSSIAFRLLTGGSNDQFPDWSIAEDILVFESTRQMVGGLRGIWTVNGDGSGLKRLGSSANDSWRMPAWSPDGQRIVHVRYPVGTAGGEIFVMDRDGGNAVRLTTDAADDNFPRLSPDGTQIAFVRPDSMGTPQVWTMNSDGTSQQQRSARGGSRPAWSPDGSTIIYPAYDPVDDSAGNGVLWSIKLVTGGESQVLPAWPNSCP
jgi:Tol biopolymer transport system component